MDGLLLCECTRAAHHFLRMLVGPGKFDLPVYTLRGD